MYFFKFLIMKIKFLIIDRWTKDFVREVYERNESDQSDYSVEYAESVEMAVYELAEQFITGHCENSGDLTAIPIGKSIQEMLTGIYNHFEECDGMLFTSLEFSEDVEQFLYSLGSYLSKGNFSEPFL